MLGYGLQWAAMGKEVVARISGKDCGNGIVQGIIDGPLATYYGVEVKSDSQVAGCGTEGATVDFYIDGRPAKPAGVWKAGASQRLDIWAGPDFAAFSGYLLLNGEPWPLSCYLLCFGPVVKALLGPVGCGEKQVEGLLVSAYYSVLIVLPDSLRQGCGREGDVVRFTVDGSAANETAAWSPGFHSLDLSVGAPVSPRPQTPTPTGVPSVTSTPPSAATASPTPGELPRGGLVMGKETGGGPGVGTAVLLAAVSLPATLALGALYFRRRRR